MKKTKSFMLSILSIIAILIPINVFANSIDLSKYNSMSLEEVFKEENITYDFSNYTENDNQIPIYLFRGNGCSYCKKFLTYLADTLLDKYGSMFKVISYEVWYDSNNADLMVEVANFFGDDAGGVPYIIIGDKTYEGYAESLNSDIESAITKLYNSTDRYDVFEEMAKNPNSESKTSSNTVAIVLWNIVITALGGIIIIYYNHQTKKQLLLEIQELKNMMKKNSKKEPEKDKKTTKKGTKKE